MDHGVARGEDRPVGVVQPEAVTSHVAGDRGDAGRDGREVVATFRAGGPQPVEGVVLEDLAFGAFRRRRALTVAHQQDEFAAGHRSQEPLDQRRAHESRGAGDGDPFPRELLGDHG